MEYFVQCLLYKDSPLGGFLLTVSWLPEKFAHVGKVLKLENDDKTWSNGWRVMKLYSRHESDFVLEHERDFARQRKASDI